jgi:hypothetical protein
VDVVKLLRTLHILNGRHTAALVRQLLIGCQCRQDVGLTQRQENPWLVRVILDHKVFDLSCSLGHCGAGKLLALIIDTHLIAPEHGIPLLRLGLVPYLE